MHMHVCLYALIHVVYMHLYMSYTESDWNTYKNEFPMDIAEILSCVTNSYCIIRQWLLRPRGSCPLFLYRANTHTHIYMYKATFNSFIFKDKKILSAQIQALTALHSCEADKYSS